MIVLESTGAEETFLVAERVRSCAGELAFYDGESLFHITLSIGLIEGSAPLHELQEKQTVQCMPPRTRARTRPRSLQRTARTARFI
ncbi:MAG: hypothetical protein Q8S22_07155 [Eubacteriales bacterium]|nr:hypothetical protein [Eubacteriales bacterium]